MTALRFAAALLLLAGCGADTAPTDAEVREPDPKTSVGAPDSMGLAPVVPDSAPVED